MDGRVLISFAFLFDVFDGAMGVHTYMHARDLWKAPEIKYSSRMDGVKLVS